MSTTDTEFCPKCDYQGYSPSGFCVLSRGEVECPECEGAGSLEDEDGEEYAECSECDGTGSVECEHSAGWLFERAVEHNLTGVHFFSVGACPGCETCFGGCEDPENPTDTDYDCASEGSFSWGGCDSCGSTLGGNLYPAHGIIADTQEQARGGDVTHFEVCTDCLCYHANGDLPEDWRG